MDYILALLIQHENMFQLTFISMNITYKMLFYHRTHGTSINSTLTVLESCLHCFSRNRLATMCIKQSIASSNNRSHVARPYSFLSMDAYTPSDNVICDEVKSALGLSLSHLQRNVLLVLIIIYI